MHQRILIIKPTALGDVAQACLVVPQIKKFWPAAHISWVVDSAYRPILELCPQVDAIIDFPRKAWRSSWPLREILAWSRQLRERRFDVALDLQGLARSGWMTWSTRALRRIGLASAREFASLAYTEKVADDALHAVDRYRQAVSQLLGQKLNSDISGIYSQLCTPEPSQLVPWSSQNYIVFHPYSMWATKLWPWERYGQIAEALPKEKFVMVGSGPFFPVTTMNILDLRGQTSLTELLRVLGHARAVISTDSGPAHLATALGRPVISIFGATDPSRTAPRCTQSIVLTAANDVPCRPCLKRTCSHLQSIKCLEEVTLSSVLEALCQLIHEPTPASASSARGVDRA